MGLFKQKKEKEVLQEHKFDYINLADFKSNSFLDRTAYISLLFGIFISLAGYVADVYTCVTLLAFNRWSSKIEPIIPLYIARIVFSVCILVSLLLLGLDWYFAIKVIRGDGVADAYMNPVALRWNSVWGGKRKEDSGWRRFLVFARLTSERSKREYIALFTYFAFQGWVRILVAEGPRVVINTLTLVSVVRADLLPTTETETLSILAKLFENIGHLAETSSIEAMTLSTMAFTTVLWVFGILQLLLAGLLYLCYLWHVCSGGTLRKYCKERIDTRMGEVVKKNHMQGLEEEKKHRDERLNRQPKLPEIANEEKFTYSGSPVAPPMPALTRIQALQDMDDARSIRPSASKVSTATSQNSFARPGISRVPTNGSEMREGLVGGQAEMGYGGRGAYGGRRSQDSQFSSREPARFDGGYQRMQAPGPPPSQMGTPTPEYQSEYMQRGMRGPPPSQRSTPVPDYRDVQGPPPRSMTAPEYQNAYGPPRNMRTPGPPPSQRGTPAPEYQSAYGPPWNMRTPGPSPSQRGTPTPEYQEAFSPHMNIPPPSQRGTPAPEYQNAYGPPRNMRTPGPPPSQRGTPAPKYQGPYGPPLNTRFQGPPPSQRGTPAPEYQSEMYGSPLRYGTPAPEYQSDLYSQNSSYTQPDGYNGQMHTGGPSYPANFSAIEASNLSPHQSPIAPRDPEYPMQDLNPQPAPNGQLNFVLGHLAHEISPFDQSPFDPFGDNSAQQPEYGADDTYTASPTTYVNATAPAYASSNRGSVQGSPPRRTSSRRTSSRQRFPIKLPEPEPLAENSVSPPPAALLSSSERGSISTLPRLQTNVYSRSAFSPTSATVTTAKSERFPIAVRSGDDESPMRLVQRSFTEPVMRERDLEMGGGDPVAIRGTPGL
ncbi:Potassium transporter [Rhizina undulata]